MAKVAVALSGGVDSAVAALFLQQAGHQVLGLSLDLGHGQDAAPQSGAQVARQVGIEHQVVPARGPFQRLVVEPAVEAYATGRTPNPCAVCNARVKLPLLWRQAQAQGYEALATGHYCALRQVGGRHLLAEAAAGSKNQAYFLARVDQELLPRLRFPLASLSKDQVRQAANQAGLLAAQRPESQDGCFLGPGGWDELVRAHGRVRPGLVEDPRGRTLGSHEGIHRFTVGQRRGLGLALGQPVYVLAIDGARAAVTVGPGQELMARGLRARGVRWYGEPPDQGPYQVRLRYAHRGVGCRLRLSGQEMEIEFEKPQRAITPGQLAVVYRNGLVQGSAWIEHAT